MGSVIEPGQLVDHDELPVFEDLVVQEAAAVGEHYSSEVVPGDHRNAVLAEVGSMRRKALELLLLGEHSEHNAAFDALGKDQIQSSKKGIP